MKKIIKLLTSLLLSLFLFFALQNSAFAADCVWTGSVSTAWGTAGNWTNCGGNVPGANDNVIIGSSSPNPTGVHITQATTITSLTIQDNSLIFDYDAITNGHLQITDDLIVQSNGDITHTAATSAGGGTVVGTVGITAVDVEVQAGGKIDANGKGYPFSSGSGQGCDTAGGAGGGGYGGTGGRGAGCTTGGTSYSNFRTPIYLGSGGGEQQAVGYGTSGAGGGAIEIYATNSLSNYGHITVHGQSGTGNNGAGGSGGSIFISAGALIGDSYFGAKGGDGGSYAGGGGGGRIFISVDNSSYSGSIDANQGTSGGSVPTTNAPTQGTAVLYYLADNHIDFLSSIILTPADEPLEYNIARIYGKMYMQSDVVSGTRVGVHFEATEIELMSSSAGIVATGRGYPVSEGPSQGCDSADGGGGGSYGGFGGRAYGCSNIGDMIGTMSDLKTAGGKINVGSGAGENTDPYWGISGAGGGGIWIVAETLTLPSGSSIVANGGNGTGNNGGGGAGGAILLEVGTIEGSGSISANGGDGGPYAGGGGGGRIMINYEDKSGFSGSVTAAKGVTGVNVPVGQRAYDGSAVMINSDTDDLDIFSSMSLSDADGTISYHDITIASNRTIYLWGSDLAGTGVGVTMTASGTFTLPSSSTISADGLGFPKQLGTGVGCAGDGAGGAAHGGSGLGGAGCGGTGTTYGNANGPVTLGSGGGNNTSGSYWGISAAGGGAIKIIANDMLLNGTISANSGEAFNNNGGGGSGGSIWLDVAGEIDGSGIVRANGGNGRPYGGGGGGGRILIEYGTNSFSGTVTANGGTRGSGAGGGTAGSGSIVF